MKMRRIFLVSLCLVSSLLYAEEEARECKDVLVDEVTDMAFADQGQPFTGKVACYYDEEKKRLKSVRTFVEGIPTGTHDCYRWDGAHDYSIIYLNGKRHKKGFFVREEYHTGLCVKESSPVDWCVKKYKSDCF